MFVLLEYFLMYKYMLNLVKQRNEQFHHIDFLFYVLDPSLAGQCHQIRDPALQTQDQPPQIWVGLPPQT